MKKKMSLANVKAVLQIAEEVRNSAEDVYQFLHANHREIPGSLLVVCAVQLARASGVLDGLTQGIGMAEPMSEVDLHELVSAN